MPRTKTTVEKEAQKRADKAGIPMDVVRPYVRAEVEKRPIQLEYVIAKHLDMAEIFYFSDVDAVRCELNISHSWVRHVMLGEDVTPEMRAKIEIMVMAILGVEPGVVHDDEKWAFYLSEAQRWSKRLQVASDIMFEPDPKTGENMFGMVVEAGWAEDRDGDDDN